MGEKQEIVGIFEDIGEHKGACWRLLEGFFYIITNDTAFWVGSRGFLTAWSAHLDRVGILITGNL